VTSREERKERANSSIQKQICVTGMDAACTECVCMRMRERIHVLNTRFLCAQTREEMLCLRLSAGAVVLIQSYCAKPEAIGSVAILRRTMPSVFARPVRAPTQFTTCVCVCVCVQCSARIVQLIKSQSGSGTALRAQLSQC